jgi:hypothetical protein
MRGRGGVVEDILVSNVSMYNILNEGILITLRYQSTTLEPLSERTPSVHNVQLSNINIRGANRPVAIYGLEEKDVTDVSLNDIRIFSEKGILIENSSGISFHDLKMEIKDGIPLEAKDSEKVTWDMVAVYPRLKNQPFLKLTNCKDVRVSNCYQQEKSDLYVSEDEHCSDIYIINNVLPGILKLHNNKGKNIVTLNNITNN